LSKIGNKQVQLRASKGYGQPEKDYIVKPINSYNNCISQMDEWCLTHHTKNGLISKLKTAEKCIKTIEGEIIKMLDIYTETGSIIYIAGNSVHFDKKFIDHYMSDLSNKMSYKILDVTSFAILCKNLNGKIFDKRPFKKYKHTALSDIWESINEYAYYIENFLNLENVSINKKLKIN
jgi:oligoribonuclease